MGKISWHLLLLVAAIMGLVLSCGLPSGAAAPPLTAAAAQQTIDNWNPQYCKVAEFYGFYKSEAGPEQVAYVLMANPSDRAQKPAVYAARFQLLTSKDGQQRWFLTSLVTHGSGLTRRQGWDNLIIPVKEGGASSSR
ncbi:MAG: hypothetical protein FJ134_00230 [Deltaproteobacteria bacterium]|nr:hypothetical protein [Deltaproteobacteria bacterium]